MKKRGSPQQVDKEQYSVLEKAGKLQSNQKSYTTLVKKGVLNIDVHLPGHAVSLFKVNW